jgi:prolyl-tRNA synthetase
MGSYGIGLERILSSAIELYHDELGIVLPKAIAPFQAVITLLRPDDPAQRAAAESWHQELMERGIDCLLDDRDERPGVKFKDAELIGIPVRLTVGKKLQEGVVELFSRRDRSSREVPAAAAVPEVCAALERHL